MPPFVIGAFRTSFPEFQDTAKYPDTLINVWALVAANQVSYCAWGAQYLLGLSLYVAHEITLEAQGIAAAQAGGVPGSQGGVANTKTVGSVTVGYDSQSTAEKDAGWWNLTTYGKQYFRLAQMYGTKAIQL